MKTQKTRVNPFARGAAEWVLYDRFRRATCAADAANRAAVLAQTEESAYRDKANRYADALRALGHGDKVPGQTALMDLTKQS